MQFIPHPKQTRSLGAPLGWDHSKVHCGSLSICDKQIGGVSTMESLWKPEGNEGILLALGGAVALNVYGGTHPPVSMHLEYKQPDREEYIKQLCAAFVKLLESARDNRVLIGVNLGHLAVQDMDTQ